MQSAAADRHKVKQKRMGDEIGYRGFRHGRMRESRLLRKQNAAVATTQLDVLNLDTGPSEALFGVSGAAAICRGR